MLSPEIFSPIELLEHLESPFVIEAFSSLTGRSLLVVDFRPGSSSLPDDLLSRSRTSLAQIPCPTVALCAGADPDTSLFLNSFDIVLRGDTVQRDLAAISDTVAAAPLASMALVQLLRHSAGLSVHEGLIAESLVYSTLQSGPEFQGWLTARMPVQRKPCLEPAVLSERADNCLRISLNRPAKRNAFSAEMRDGLFEALQVAVSDPSISEVVIRGQGPSFCSGGDLDEFGSLPDPATAHAIRSTRNVGRVLASLATRARFELHGACVGAGMELPAFVSRVTAKEGTFFELPEVGLGLVPGAGGTASIPRRIGRQRTAYLALSRVRLDAATALRWGLIDEIDDDIERT